MSRNLLMTIEFHGEAFHGWQRQKELRSVQGELEDALATILRHPVTLYGAGRTDAGVHGLAVRANFKTTSDETIEKINHAVNGITGRDLTVYDITEVADDFHARYSATGRHYIYLLLERRSALWEKRACWPKRFPQVDLMNQAVSTFPGQHDFAGFSIQNKDERGTDSFVFYARWEKWERGLAFRIGAVRFLNKMVRCIIGHSLAVGLGSESLDQFTQRLNSPLGRGELVAPAHGLHFASCDYTPAISDLPWTPDCLPDWPVL